VEGSAGNVGLLPRDTRELLGLRGSTREYWALNNLVFMSVLMIQFGIGMGINLFVGISKNHPGAGASSFFSGALHSIWWAIRSGPIALAVHTALGIAVAVHSIHNTVWNAKWGTLGSAIAAGAGAVFVWTASVNGALFLIHDRDLNSMLMAVLFGAAMLSYATVVFLLMRGALRERAAA